MSKNLGVHLKFDYRFYDNKKPFPGFSSDVLNRQDQQLLLQKTISKFQNMQILFKINKLMGGFLLN